LKAENDQSDDLIAIQIHVRNGQSDNLIANQIHVRNGQSKDPIAIQSMCNTIDLGLCLKTLTRESVVAGFRSAEIGGPSEEAAKYSQGENVATLGHRSSVPNNWP
jgi:hypothetical protein